MKQFLPPLVFLLLSLNLPAQITIERSDYLLEIGDTTSFWLANSPDNLSLPTEGEDLIWDYRNISYDTTSPFFFTHPAGTDSNFPNSNIVISASTSGFIPGLTLPVTFVLQLDNAGNRTLGRIDGAADTPLESMTGNPNDSINFLGNINNYETPVIDAYFPMNYNDSQNGNLVVRNPFLLTIEAFGLDHVPGSGDFLVHNEITVVGWGTLQVSDLNGGEDLELEVLLRKDVATKVDTFSLGGGPAPQALLDAFGLTQGRVQETIEYSFWAKGLDAAVMVFTLESDGSQMVRINEDIPMILSSVQDVAEPLQAISISPNPSAQDFYAVFEQGDTPATSLSVLNTLGQVVHQQNIPRVQGQTEIPISLDGAAGIYQVLLQNEKGKITGREKIMLLK